MSSFPLLSSKLTKLSTELKITLLHSNLLLALVNLLDILVIPSEGWSMILVFTLEFVPMFTLSSQFILSIWEMHTHDMQGRHGSEIDTGFGLSVSGCDAVEMVLVFADVAQNEGSVDMEEVMVEIGMTEPGMGSTQAMLST